MKVTTKKGLNANEEQQQVAMTSLHYTQNMSKEELKRDPPAGHRKVALQHSHYIDVI